MWELQTLKNAIFMRSRLLRADLKCERDMIVLPDVWFVWAPIRAFSTVALFIQSLYCMGPDV